MTGNFFEALRLVEDETVVRQAAQAAIDTAVSRRELLLVETLTYVRREVFETPGAFLERIILVDPSRREVVDRDRNAITSAVIAAAQRNQGGRLVFDQPIKADILRPA